MQSVSVQCVESSRPLVASGRPFVALRRPAWLSRRRVNVMAATQMIGRSRHLAWIAALWGAGGLFDASQTVLFMHAMGRRQPWLIFVTELVSWLPWVLATPFIIGLARRYPIFPRPRLSAVICHFSAFSIVGLVAEAWFAVLQVLFNPWESSQASTFEDAWRSSLVFQFLTYLIVYALILGFTSWLDARERRARESMETARLSAALSKSQLAALRQQIEPHFMFNALHSITGLVRDHETEAAVSMIVGLSEFLRRGLEDSHRAQVSLTEEIEYLQRYLDLQKLRFGERLQVTIDISSELLAARVPNLLLQPLVENAIKHGIAKRATGGTVRISGVRENGILRLCIYNDPPDAPIGWPEQKKGVGLSNLRTRLQILHGSASQLELKQADTGGVEVIVRLPFET
jgi:two-component system, LytTR family, sensor kinase